MKKYSIIALFVALVVSLSSCNDDFMQRNPIDDMAMVRSLRKKPICSYIWTEFIDIMYMVTVTVELTVPHMIKVSWQ